MRRSLALAVALLVCALVGASAASAASSDLFFSEYVEGSGEQQGARDLQRHGGARSTSPAGGYNVQIFFNGSATAGLTIPLTGTVANGDVFVFAQSAADRRDPGPGRPDERLGLVQRRRRGRAAEGHDGARLDRPDRLRPRQRSGARATQHGRQHAAPQADDHRGRPERRGRVRPGGRVGRVPDGHVRRPRRTPSAATAVVVACPPSLSMLQGTAGTAAVSATDPNGTVTSLTLGPVSPVPASGSISLGPASRRRAPSAARRAGTLSVSANVPAGSYAVEVDAANDDATPQTGSCTTIVNVQQVLRVSDVQGAVTDLVDGPTFRSPLAPESGNGTSSTTYFVRGVITQKTLARTSAGASQNGFFLQDTLARSDSDPNTSDGIFVFMGGFTTLIGGYVPRIGDEVVHPGTGLGVLRHDRAVQRLARAARQPHARRRRCRAGVRREPARRPRGCGPVLGAPRGYARACPRRRPRDGRPGRLRLDRGQRGLARPRRLGRRTAQQPYARRAFRDAHPLDNQPGALRRRQRLSHPARAARCQGDRRGQPRPAAARPGLRLARHGGRRRRRTSRSTSTGSTPRRSRCSRRGSTRPSNAPPAAFDRSGAYSIANFNVENLYDYRDDPFDGCDFTGNAGCPGVAPPFDYVPESQAAYDEHLGTLASEVANDLHGPDILLVQEAEDQDICTVAAGALQCGTTNNADGKPDTLQELALRIAALGGPAYDAAFDRNGADDRGIVAAFLYRTDRVQLLPVAAGDPVLGSTPGVTYRGAALAYNADVSNPKALNAVPAGRRRHLDRRGRVERLHAGASGRALPRVAQRRRPRRVGRPLRGVEPLLVRPGYPRRAADRAGELPRRDRRRASRRPTRRHGSTRVAT